jgi:hypothetical protein
MTETLNQYETEHSQDYYEQSPDSFIDSLTIFDSYTPIPEGKERDPEQQMPFASDEQELVKGIRGTLEDMALAAKAENRTVSIPGLFTALDETIRGSDADDITKDQLFLVATKMRYHLQLRYDKTIEGTKSEPIPAVDPLVDAAMHDNGFLRTYTKTFLSDSLHDAQRQAEPREEEWREWAGSHTGEFNDPDFAAETKPDTAPNYDAKAQSIIAEKTGGVDFNTLDKKLQGKITRGLARDYHPDLGGNEELYKAITQQTDVKTGDDSTTDTRSY